MNKLLGIKTFFIFLIFSIFPFHYANADNDQSTYILDTEVVTSAKIEEYLTKYPQRVSVLNRNEIEERNFLEVGEALDSMPGVETKSYGSGGTIISIRGGIGKVLVLINGRPLNSTQYGGVNLGSIPIDMVKKITVFKPPVPVWLGPGAVNGAINIITREFAGKGTESEKSKTRLKVSAGSYGNANTSISLINPGKKHNIMVTAGAQHRDGKRENSDRDVGRLSFHWDKKNETFTSYDLNGRFYYTEKGSPGPDYNLTPDARQRYSSTALDLMIKGMMGKIGDFSTKIYTDIEDLKDESQTGLTSTLDVYKIGLKSEGIWSKEESFSLRSGITTEHNYIDHTLSGEHNRDKFSLHSQIDNDWKKFATSFGVRADYTNDFDFSPALNTGVSYKVNPNSAIKANVGYSEKPPTFNQLYQPSHGSIDQVRGNPDLDKEKIYSYDLGFEYKWGKKAYLETVLFRTETKDLIIYHEGDDLINRPDNIDKGYRQGIELSYKVTFTQNFSMDMNYIYQTSENNDTNKDLTYAPNHKFKLTGKYKWENKSRLETVIRATSDQFSDTGNSQEDKIDSYVTVDLKYICPIKVKIYSCEFFANFINLLDQDFEVHHGYPDDGFRFLTGININL